jgi:hypothetical protein
LNFNEEPLTDWCEKSWRIPSREAFLKAWYNRWCHSAIRRTRQLEIFRRPKPAHKTATRQKRILDMNSSFQTKTPGMQRIAIQVSISKISEHGTKEKHLQIEKSLV